MASYYLLREEQQQLSYAPAHFLSPEQSDILHDPLRVQILHLLERKPMYAAEIATALQMHEQKIYYHINRLVAAGIIEVVERQEIRGTISKKYKPISMQFCLSLSKQWKDARELFTKKKTGVLEKFFSPFISHGHFQGLIVVGSPDPHGANKRRSRDGHYAVDLSLFLGTLCGLPSDFSVMLDVDVNALQKEKENLIVVGGPVSNMIADAIKDKLPVKFMKEEQWGIVTKRGRYSEESIGIIARLPNPFASEKWILFLAGVSANGTKSAVIALTRHHQELLSRFTGQKQWYSIVNGFDLDGDGRIDSAEVVE